jgi:hypothetical protein
LVVFGFGWRTISVKVCDAHLDALEEEKVFYILSFENLWPMRDNDAKNNYERKRKLNDLFVNINISVFIFGQCREQLWQYNKTNSCYVISLHYREPLSYQPNSILKNQFLPGDIFCILLQRLDVIAQRIAAR